MPRTPHTGPAHRTPVPVRTRRSVGDVLRAVLAFLALAALVVGVPLSLAWFVGWPLPSSVPGIEALGQEISTDVFLNILAVLVWLAWAQFTACVLVEVRAALTGVGMPRRVPGAGPQQVLARQLVSALLLLGSAAAGVTPGLASLGDTGPPSGTPGPVVVAEAERFPGETAEAPGHLEADHAMAVPDAAAPEEAEQVGDGTQFYRIQPPEGRHHDTLWGISERHLGDGLRYKEIYELNKDRVQPDGSRLSEASLIRPGWILEMPADAEGGDLVQAPHDIPDLPTDEATEYQDYWADGGSGGADGGSGGAAPPAPDGAVDAPDGDGGAAPAPDGATAPEPEPDPVPDTAPDPAADTEVSPDLSHVPDPDPDPDPEPEPEPNPEPAPDAGDSAPPEGGSGPALPEPMPGPALPEAPAEADEHVTPSPDEPAADPVQGTGPVETPADEGSFGLPDALMAAPLLAAGLLAALGRTRRTALWQAAAGVLPRSIGHDLEPRAGGPVEARDALLAGADPAGVAFLDRALRRLSADLDADGRTLPAVYAAWLSDTELHLQLAAAAGPPPAPWRTGQGENYWRLAREALTADVGGQPDAEAPYPGLVSLGTRDGIRLLVNLESVPGVVSVVGRRRDRDAVLASVAAELATSGWADRMTVSLVGFGADLTALAPTRVRHLEDVAGLLEVMETETSLRHSNLQYTGQDSVLAGRVGRTRGHQWAPHLVIIGVQPTEAEADRLGALASVSAALGIGYVIGSEHEDLPGLSWEFRIAPDGTLTEPAMGLDVVAQRLPEAQQAAVTELFAALAVSEDGRPVRTGQHADDPPAFLLDLSERGRPEVYAQLMGGYALQGLPEPEPERAARLREALALLLLHRTGVHPRVLASALWPRGVSDEVRDAFVARLGEWLGTDSAGRARLRVDARDGRLSLPPTVASDWDVLRTLHHRVLVAPQAGQRDADRVRQLTDALQLAQGPLLAGERVEGRYGWLEHEIVDAQYPLLVAEIALALSEAQRAAGEGEPAYLAVRSALGAAPADERLWNELLRAAHATGRSEWLTGAVGWLVHHHGQLFGVEQRLPAETEALLDELHPGWRQGAEAMSR